MSSPAAEPVAQIPVTRIRMHPRNVRTALTGLEKLAASIRQVGVLEPLVVHRKHRRGPGVQDLELLMGHRRLAAAELAGLSHVPCIVRPHHRDDEAILVMLGENTQREPADAKGLANAVRALRYEFDYDLHTIAEKTGMPVDQVRAWLAGVGSPTVALGAAGMPRVSTSAPARPQRTARPRPVSVAPRIPARRVHELLAEHDAGHLDAAAFVARFRGLLGGWEPEPPAPKPPETSPDWAAVEALTSGRLKAQDVRPADRRAAVRELTDHGASADQIAARTGMTARSVQRHRGRAS